MVRKTIVIFSLVLICFVHITKAQAYINTLTAQANEMVAAAKKGDYKTLLKYTHPKIVNMMGGHTKALAKLTSTMVEMEKDQFKIVSAKVGKVGQTIVGQKNIQAIIPQMMEMTVGNRSASSQNYLFCISYDGGKNWYFLDTGNSPEAQIRKMFPEMSPKLVIPKSSQSYQ